MVNGAKSVVDGILDHPLIRAISFVGSTPVAKYIYSRAAANGKRVQCQGGAKNPIVILPDADMDMTTKIMLIVHLVVLVNDVQLHRLPSQW